jgi:DNA polymerase III subunit delta'
MPIPPLYGHEGIRNRLAGAIASGRLPQALLFEGPPGVGKQRLALWLAQALVCENSGSGKGEPCGACRHCKLALTLSHPDVHWFVPVELSKKGADADKQLELVAEALGEEMTARRERPLYQPPAGLASHGIASVRLLLRQVALTPALARRKVFIVGDAERLVPQTGADAAANALLKALEEPPADTVFVLTAAEPEALLPTILSRVVRVRVARLADSIVAAFAQRELGATGQRERSQRVTAAEGRIGRLLAEGDRGAGGEAAAERFLGAVQGGRARRYAAALALQPFQARGGFTDMLDGLLGRLREQARAGRETGKVVAAIARVLEARGLAQGNVNPQLVAAVLADDLADERREGEGEGKPE